MKSLVWFAALVLSMTGAVQPAWAETLPVRSATAAVLGRELPLAIEAHQIQHLSHYFAEDVTMTANVPNGQFSGKKTVLLAFEWNPMRTEPQISAVIVGIDSVVVIQNLPRDGLSDRGTLAPRIDTFRIGSSGKVIHIEIVIGDKVMHREGHY